MSGSTPDAQMVRVTTARQAAPSFKSWKLVDPNFKGFGRGRGNVPTARVIIAYDETGYAWVHERIFRAGEYAKLKKLQDSVEQRGSINPAHWRKADKGEY